MKAYQFNSETHEYVDEVERQPSPLEPGVYWLPANSTDVPPPLLQEREAAVWMGKGWNVIPDYRLVPLWHKQTLAPMYVKLGEIPSGDLTEVPPPIGVERLTWDDLNQNWKEVPLTSEELATREKAFQDAEFLRTIVDVVKDLQLRVAALELKERV